MLRPAIVAIAFWLLVGACALVEAPPPPGTILVQLQVTNHGPRAAQLAVVSGRPIAGAVQPSTVPPGASGDVRFFVPMASDWTITVNGQDLILRQDLGGQSGVIDDKGIEIDQQGNISWWCSGRCP